MKQVKAPARWSWGHNGPAIFLAGSIEMGTAVDWQEEVATKLAGAPGVILNPRRDDWDSSWEQKIENPQFNEQVSWELEAMEYADHILMYFAPSTKSPITLAEFGLYVRSDKLTVCCPEGFWRKGNVDIMCARYKTRTVDTLDDLVGVIA